MKPKNSSVAESPGLFRPFAQLEALLKQHSVKISAVKPSITASGATSPSGVSTVNDHVLFQQEMADVIPLAQHNRHLSVKPPQALIDPLPQDRDADAEALSSLRELIDSGKGFTVADTAEYMDGANHDVHPEMLARLHRGDFTVQAVIDLHGHSAPAANEAFDAFLKESIALGRRSILVVHGRGLSSPDKPVLKSKVKNWLTSGPYKKWVMAFSSARLCDGGAGATCILLRKSPLTRRLKKKKNRQD